MSLTLKLYAFVLINCTSFTLASTIRSHRKERRQEGRGDDVLSLVAVVVRGPAGSAVRLTRHSDGRGGKYCLQDLQTRPQLDHKGKSTHEGTTRKSGSGGAVEGQLTVLSHAGYQVRKQEVMLL